MKRMKRFAVLLGVLSLILPRLAVGAVTVSSECEWADADVYTVETAASAVGQALEIEAKSAVLIEQTTGTVLYEDHADQALPPASLTKIMSLLLIMEALDAGQFDTETVLQASDHACSMGGSQIWLEPGEAMTVDDLLKATVVASANDATVVLAEAVAGSEEGFVARMNTRAAELGMTGTHFLNCTGLDAEGHVTTAADMAIAAAELMRHPLITCYSTIWMDTLRDGESELVNTNKLIRFYDGATGIKTGTTSAAGYCLAATATRDGLSLVAVVLAGESSAARFSGAQKLLNFGFANFGFCRIAAELPADYTLPVSGGLSAELPVTAAAELSCLYEKTETGEISQELLPQENLQAPIHKGDKVGTVVFLRDGTEIGRTDLIAAQTVNKRTFGRMLCRLLLDLCRL